MTTYLLKCFSTIRLLFYLDYVMYASFLESVTQLCMHIFCSRCMTYLFVTTICTWLHNYVVLWWFGMYIDFSSLGLPLEIKLQPLAMINVIQRCFQGWRSVHKLPSEHTFWALLATSCWCNAKESMNTVTVVYMITLAFDNDVCTGTCSSSAHQNRQHLVTSFCLWRSGQSMRLLQLQQTLPTPLLTLDIATIFYS